MHLRTTLVQQVFTGTVPFAESYHSAHIIYKIITGERPQRPTSSSLGITNNIWFLMRNCWQPEWFSRPSMSYIVAVLEYEWPAERLMEKTTCTRCEARLPASPTSSAPHHDPHPHHISRRSLSANGRNFDFLRSHTAVLLPKVSSRL